MFERTCHICGKLVEERNTCVYWDEDRGIYAATICKTCYAKHILKYYPDGLMAEYIRNNFGEYGIEAKNETIDEGRKALVHGVTLDKEIRQIGLFDALETICKATIEQSTTESHP